MEGSTVEIEFVHNCRNDQDNAPITTDSNESHFNVAMLRTKRHNSLALWMAGSIVRSHGGKLTVRQELGDVHTAIILPVVFARTDQNDPGLRSVATRNDIELLGVGRPKDTEKYTNEKQEPPPVDAVDMATPVETISSPNGSCEKEENRTYRSRTNEVSGGSSVLSMRYDSDTKRKYRVLVVDDVLSNRKILSRLLTSKGHECSLAVDGLDCIRMVHESHVEGRLFEAICMDFEMPQCDGPTATKRLRDMGFTMPIIGIYSCYCRNHSLCLVCYAIAHTIALFYDLLSGCLCRCHGQCASGRHKLLQVPGRQ
jgi:CheY-like chemotaxis protein